MTPESFGLQIALTVVALLLAALGAVLLFKGAREDSDAAALDLTDAERPNDRGYAMPRDEFVGARTFPAAAYEFANPSTSSGDIYVRP